MNWIKVEDGMPENGQICLVTMKYINYPELEYKYCVQKFKYDIEKGWLYEDWDDGYFVGWHTIDNIYDDEDKVIAWRPYPEPYKGG